MTLAMHQWESNRNPGQHHKPLDVKKRKRLGHCQYGDVVEVAGVRYVLTMFIGKEGTPFGRRILEDGSEGEPEELDIDSLFTPISLQP